MKFILIIYFIDSNISGILLFQHAIDIKTMSEMSCIPFYIPCLQSLMQFLHLERLNFPCKYFTCI